MIFPKLKKKMRKIWEKSAKRLVLNFRKTSTFLTFAVLKKITVVLLLVGLNWSGIVAIGQTFAYFNDTETSSGNMFAADFLDFALSVSAYESSIGLGETVSASSVVVNSGGMDFQYVLEAETISGNEDFCNALELEAKLNGVEKYEGALMSLGTIATTSLGTWKFNIELPVDEDSFTNGEKCQFDVVFRGWQTNVGSYGDGGFTDEERMSFTITTGQMVVLNEFLPRPSGVAYGFDFGNDSSDMPQGEWVELYNNSTEAVDLTGWYTRDSTGGDGNKVIITALNTSPATTVIAGKSWLVIYMNKAVLNNTGDTVRLFDAGNNLIDSHSYDDPDFCEIEPTPGNENSTDASGSCGSVPPNKSYARIPDGIGAWVDPIPTPGRANVIEEEQEPIVGLQNENQNTSSSFSETLESATNAITEFVSGGEEVAVSASASTDTPEPSPEPTLEPSPEPSVTPESTVIPEPADSPQPPVDDDSSIQVPPEPAIPEEPVTIESPTEPVPPPADLPAPAPAE